MIDNASDARLYENFDLSWHPAGRHLYVERLGKTHALLTGIKEAKGEILVVVDDDNVLAADYLAKVREIFESNPFLGVIGGRIEGEYEEDPPEWAKPYLLYLAVIDFGDKNFYALSPDLGPYTPPGAGMAIRKDIAEYYARQVREDPIRLALDPIGDKLSRSGDTDMALCSFEMGFAKGYFPELKLTHLIPKARLEPGYIQRLVEGSEYSAMLLSLVRGLVKPPPSQYLPFWRRQLSKLIWRIKNRKTQRLHLAMRKAMERGRNDAQAYYQSLCSAEGVRKER